MNQEITDTIKEIHEADIYVEANTHEEAIKKAERLKANGKYYSVILEKITYKYKTVKKWED